MGWNGQQGEVGEQTMIRENIRTIGINENPLNQIYADRYLYASPRGLTNCTNTHTAYEMLHLSHHKTLRREHFLSDAKGDACCMDL